MLTHVRGVIWVENNGAGVFRSHVGGVIWVATATVFSTHIASLRDYGKYRGYYFLPTFRPYGTRENNGPGVFQCPVWGVIWVENNGPGVFRSPVGA